jgi:hypothetical protein
MDKSILRFKVHRSVALAGPYIYDNVVLKCKEPFEILDKYKPYIKILTELLEKEKIKIIDINDIILSTIKYEQYRLSNFPEKIRKYMIRSCFNVKIMDSIFTNLYKNFKNIIKEISEDRINNMCSVKITIEEEKRIIINNTETDSSLQYILLQTKSYSRPTCHLMLLIKSNEVWNLFDPNGSHLYYSNIMNSEEYQEIINKTVGENVNMLFHKTLNNTSELNWFSFDKGLCGVWCILLLHMLYLCPDKKVIEVIDFFTSMDAFTRAITIYSYCCGIFHIVDQL